GRCACAGWPTGWSFTPSVRTRPTTADRSTPTRRSVGYKRTSASASGTPSTAAGRRHPTRPTVEPHRGCPMPATDTRPIARSRPRRHWLRRFAVAGVALVGLLASYLWLDHYQEERAWRAACAEADQLDPGWRWDDLLATRPNPPDDRNAAVRVREVLRLLPGNWLNAIPYRGLLDWDRNQRPYPDQSVTLRTGLATVAEALAQAEGLEGLPTGRLPREYPSPLLINLVKDVQRDTQDTREVAILLRLQAMRLAEDGRADDALTVVRQSLGTARAARSEPLLINALVSLALRNIG